MDEERTNDLSLNNGANLLKAQHIIHIVHAGFLTEYDLSFLLKAQHVIHVVHAGFLTGDEGSGCQGAGGVAISIGGTDF